ncbi:hypothetical protein COCMIDRAFT_110373 [Bipolaris oryzae ATCC 44560]|uniref:Uncharacterized protein n=1 Tax=Bipolaris oryzae ATCC 44560 TaxID=930090 RepID=W6YWE5_COCMI|nr:uncharacterized protein COCMIDRAFT_110373 [Bipolaris oryzae ATCC 44560]EUC39859.1 hypothetical protein COCMIDRAFT_110373 [Bipolaris oryzae ATCC 44560]
MQDAAAKITRRNPLINCWFRAYVKGFSCGCPRMRWKILRVMISKTIRGEVSALAFILENLVGVEITSNRKLARQILLSYPVAVLL